MARVLVVADDLTGANATGARFARVGLSTASVTSPAAIATVATDHDVVVASTSSRHLAPDEAARRVEEVIAAIDEVAVVVKRIDTTLRGNLGSEVEAALGRVRRHHPDARAIVVPAFPEAGRITVGGLQLVDGVSVARSPAGRDPLAPVTSSRVADLLGQQADLHLREVHLDVVQGDEEVLTRTLAGRPIDAATTDDGTAGGEVAGDGRDADVLVVDATDRRDLATIARAAARCATEHGTHWLVVDPGPFGPELATAMGLTGLTADDHGRPEGPRPALPLLVVAGSVSRTTRDQLVTLERVHDVAFLDLDVTAFDAVTCGEALARLLIDAPAGGIVGLRTAPAEGQLASLDTATAQELPHRLGTLVGEALRRAEVGGLYLTGGDVTRGVLDALDASAIVIDDEVLPLAVTGRLVAGPHAGLRIVTKGGLIGDHMAAVTCVDALRHRRSTDRKAPP